MPATLTTPQIPFDDILVEDRIRTEVKNPEELAESILEHGLWHPLVITTNDTGSAHPYKLVAGGRRHAAWTLLKFNKVEGAEAKNWDMVPVTLFSDLPRHRQIMIELEENLKRENMTWQDNVKGLYEYHKAAKRAALLDGEKWSQAATGQLLNMAQAEVSVALTLYEYVHVKKDELVSKAETMFEACKIIKGYELDALQAEQMRRIQLKREEQKKAGLAAPSSSLPQNTTGIVVTRSEMVGGATPQGTSLILNTGSPAPKFTKEQIAAFYHHGNALEVLPVLAKATIINHIICDPPYGIETENIEAAGIDRVAATHVVEDNLKLLPAFLRICYDVISDDGYLCMWYDLDHHEKIANWAKDVGWKVQRWPLVWCKTTPCSNSQAQYNLTKVTEVCYYFRKSERSMLRRKGLPNYIVGPNERNATHPFVKPDYLWERIIEDVSAEGQVIVDPFAGEGSCLAACFKRGRNPIGIEIDEKHIASGLGYIQDRINPTASILDDIILPPI